MLPAEQPKDELNGFLGYLFDGLEGYAYSPTLDRETGEFHQEWFEWPAQRGELVDWIKAKTETLEVYLAPAVWKSPVLNRDHFAATNVVWTEFDGEVPTDLGSVPEPTLRVQSSAEDFQHWYWRLSSPLTDVTTVEAINRSLTYTLGADASAWDATQILRPVGTTNHKRESPVLLAALNKGAVEISLFDSVPTVPEPEVKVSPTTIPDVTDVVLKYAWPQEVIELYKTKEFPQGKRSSALMALGYHLAEMGLTDAEMFSVLRNADDRWGKFKDRRDRNQRLIDLIAKTRLKFPVDEIGLSDPNQIPVYGYQTFLNTEVEIEWVIQDYLERQGYMLLTGPSGVGKTQFSLRFAMNLALGRSYLGLEIERPYRMIFISCEMGHAALKFFLATMSKDLTSQELQLLEQNLIIVPLGEPWYLDNPTGQHAFEELLQVLRPDGFMFDSIGSSTTGELSTESTVKALMDFNDRIRNRYGVFTWYIHHNRKATSDNKKPNKLSDVYGNQYLVNRATSVYCLWPNGNKIEILPLKKRLAILEEPWQVVRTPELDFHKQAMTGFNLLPGGLSTPTQQPDDEIGPPTGSLGGGPLSL